MPSLRSLVAAHRTVLMIDSASTCIQVALWHSSRERERVVSGGCERERVESSVPDAIWRTSDQEAGIAIFTGVEAVLAQTAIGMAGLGALVFCEGPGSILGIRTAAMALRIWSRPDLPVFAYRSLELVAHELRHQGIPEPFAVIADARRNSWHWVDATAGGAIGALQRVPPDTMAGFGGRLFTPAGFRAWTQPPGEVSTIPYDLADLWSHQADTDLLHPAPHPDAFLHEEVTYLAWAPQIHRAKPPQAS
jgi:tRNA threonylcarbamoyladenosine biosynthesis protein TsaB